MTHPVDPEARAARFIALEMHESTHDRLVWGMRRNRDKAVAGVPEGEKLRELASQIKEHTLTHLDQYLEQFEANATKLGTQDRGLLRAGNYADITLFDPERVIDRATYTEPFQYSEGIEYVLVNGQIVLEKGQHTGARPGRALRMKQ